MNLLAPRIHGPVSECSSRIRVQGQFPGATVEIVDVDTGNVVASDVASSADDRITVSGALVPEHRLAALQTMGADSSGLSAETVGVQHKPDPIPPAVLPEPLFACARCVWIDGLVPGATAKALQGGATIGSGVAHEGFARVHFANGITDQTVVIETEACGDGGEPKEIQPAAPPAGEEQGTVLPAPTVQSPLQECRNRVTISDVIPGAEVELDRSAGPGGISCFDRTSLWWGLNPPLSLYESVRARQRMLDCEKFSEWSDPVIAGSIEPLPIPTVVGPLCDGGTTIQVCGLLAGARVRILIVPHGHHGLTGGDVWEGVAPEDGCFDFALPAPGLAAGNLVCATQELCGRESGRFEPVMVHEEPDELGAPVVVEPLFACSITVPLENLRPGSRVYVHVDGIGEIGQAHVTDEEMALTVRPALQAGQEVWAYATGCGQESDRSNVVQVQEAPEELPPPTIVEPLFSCAGVVVVRNVLSGAAVDLYVDGSWVGRSFADGEESELTVDVGSLEVGDVVTATQSICDVTSRPSRRVTVRLFDGEWFVLPGGDGEPDEDKTKVFAVHAALLPSAKVVMFSGDQYTNDDEPVDNTALMDAGHPWSVSLVHGLGDEVNLFCCGHSMLADGSVLTGGGTYSRPPQGWHTNHWLGLRASMRFRLSGPVWGWDAQGLLVTARDGDIIDPADPDDSGGRWYPTLVTLPDGRVLAIGGHPLRNDRRHTNTSLELYDPTTGQWSFVGSVDYSNIPGANQAVDRNLHSEYPSAHVLPDGSVFFASAMADGAMHKWQPGNDALHWCRVADTPAGYGGNPQPYSSVLLPLSWERDFSPEVLLLGRETAHTINPGGACVKNGDLSRSWTPTSARTLSGPPPRIYPLATMLPTSEVLVSGGTRNAQDDTALQNAEIFDATVGTWRTVDEPMHRVRNYHSVALLLPDGSVMHAGGNRNCQPGYDTQDKTVEIYRPWYFCRDRPHIGVVTDRVCHGETLGVRTSNAAAISEVVLVRLSSFTHAFNPDQRLVSLEFHRDQEQGDLLLAEVPTAPGIAVVGYYLCFVLDGGRVPSIGRFVQICPSSGSRPTPRPGFDLDLIDIHELRRRIFADLRPWPWPFPLPEGD